MHPRTHLYVQGYQSDSLGGAAEDEEWFLKNIKVGPPAKQFQCILVVDPPNLVLRCSNNSPEVFAAPKAFAHHILSY